MESRAEENPSAFAVVSPQGTYTFGEVLRRAQLLAMALLEAPTGPSRHGSRHGSFQAWPNRSGSQELKAPLVDLVESESDDVESPNLLVGLMVSPGPWMVSGPLGAWIAGRGYFALDSSHPTERIQQMVQDARAPVET